MNAISIIDRDYTTRYQAPSIQERDDDDAPLSDHYAVEPFGTMLEPTGSLYDELILSKMRAHGQRLDFLANFIDGTAFYIETLEEQLGETLDDFWQTREHAYHLITTMLIEHMKREEALGLLHE